MEQLQDPNERLESKKFQYVSGEVILGAGPDGFRKIKQIVQLVQDLRSVCCCAAVGFLQVLCNQIHEFDLQAKAIKLGQVGRLGTVLQVFLKRGKRLFQVWLSASPALARPGCWRAWLLLIFRQPFKF